MNILLLTEDFYPRTAGGAMSSWKFAKMASKEGHQVSVYTDRMEETARYEVVEGVEIHRPYQMLPFDKPPNSPLSQLTRIIAVFLLTLNLIYSLRDSQLDVIYSTNHIMHPVAKILNVFYNIPVVNFIAYAPSISGHDGTKPRSVFIFEEIIHRNFMGDIVLSRTPAISEKIREYTAADERLIDQLLNKTNIFHNREGLEDTEVRLIGGVLNKDNILAIENRLSNHRIDHSRKRLVFVGRLVTTKNAVAVPQVVAEFPDSYHLSIIGNGPEYQSVVDTIEDLGVGNRINIIGELPHRETLEQIAFADALILTSHVEAYPTVVFEALALNTEVFATPVGILPEIEHERLHLSEVEDMAKLIQDSKPNSKNIGIDQNTLDRFSMERFTEDVLEALHDACE